MNVLDYVLLVILGYCLIRGVFRGLIKELSSIVGVLGGFYAAYTYYPKAAHYLATWLSNPGYLKIVSFLIVFVTVFIVVSLLGTILKYLMNIAFLGWTDRICGAVFGGLKGVLIAVVLILILTTFLPQNANIIKRSVAAHKLMLVSAYVAKVTPKEMKQNFDIKVKELNKSWKSK